MKITDESQILDKNVRLKLIEAIEGNENKTRKREAKRRYEILKDRIKKYILQNLEQELDADTVQDMQSRIATVNIYKKVVSKKARVYKTAPKRIATEESNQEILDKLIDKACVNIKMKKANKYLEAMLNCDVFVRPIKDVHELTASGNPKYSYRIDPLPPHKYDVVEDGNDPERAMGYILSPFTDNTKSKENPQDRDKTGIVANFRDGDGINQPIADSPADVDKEYVWWGNRYHLTFDSDGEILASKTPEKGKNPIGKMPFESLAKDRDGAFWSVGGDDLIEGSILINTILSDIYYIAKMHGTGLFYMFGKGVPKTYKIGPNQAITVDIQEGDPTPQVGFANANPQLSEHKDLIEQFLAILLTTNDLEPGAVQGQLGTANASSGIQEMIIKSEPIGSVEDDQEIFKIAEPRVVKIVSKWHNLYLDKGLLIEDLAEIGKIPDNLDYSIKFGAQQQFQSEKEKLEIIEKRVKMGLDSMIDALRMDNPDLSEKEAEERLKNILEKKVQRAKESLGAIIANKENEDQLPPKSGEGADEDQEEVGSEERNS